MDIPIDLPGLDTLIPTIRGGQVLVAESGPDPAKSYFLRRLCLSALRQDGGVSFVTTRGRDEVEALFRREGVPSGDAAQRLNISERDELRDLKGFAGSDGVLALDSFTMLTLELETPDLAGLMRRLRGLCREHGTTVLLATDRGIHTPGAEAVTNHLSDGVVQFHSKEGPEGLVRFLRIPKWIDGQFVDRNVYYDFDGTRMAMDLRRRVL
ncbi:MAG: hypothetical protein L3K09_05795 [Thermoplasmata archaeon]|nr:hypothetical protein [Thermoplasmata archaeon]